MERKRKWMGVTQGPRLFSRERQRHWAAERALSLLCVMRCNEQSWPQRYYELKRPWASLDPSNPFLRPTLKKAGGQGKHTYAHVFLLYQRMVSGTVSRAALMPDPAAIHSPREVRDGSQLNQKPNLTKSSSKTPYLMHTFIKPACSIKLIGHR